MTEFTTASFILDYYFYLTFRNFI
ncbi:MAG: hypothetical protein EZS28_032421, partial [Streblomastix strix]